MRDEDLRSRIVAVACYGGMATWGEEGSLGEGFSMTSEELARRYRGVVGAFGRVRFWGGGGVLEGASGVDLSLGDVVATDLIGEDHLLKNDQRSTK